MREIKFRGWQKDLEVMVYENELLGDINYSCNPVRAMNIMLNEDDDGYVYMQYTGLKDKYGVEIYEGDIVSGDFMGKHKVEYVTEYAGFLPFVNDGGCGCCSEFSIYLPGEVEVIGNIFENKELLQEEL